MEDAITRCTGLVLQFNPLTTAPGALTKADNCVIRRENVIEDRRGYALYSTLSANLSQLMAYTSRVIAHQGTTVSYDNGSGTFSNYSGSYSAPTSVRMRSVEVNSNLLVTTSLGIKVFTDLAGTSARNAGMPRALDPDLSTTGSSGFLANNEQVAYRVVLIRTDANGNTLIGYPSQRAWLANSSGSAVNAAVTVPLPSEVLAGDVVQVYRTETSAYSSSDAAGDECYLCYQFTLTSTEVSALSLSFTDTVTNSLLGDPLYTNETQEGLAQGNDRPPLAKDIALYKSDFLFYANTKTRHRLFTSLVGTANLGLATTGAITSGSNQLTGVANTTGIAAGWQLFGTGIPAGTTVSSIVGTTITMSQLATATTSPVSFEAITNKTITLAGKTYSFSNTENTASAKIDVYTSGVAATDIDRTARSFVKVVNRYASNTSIYAYYLSGAEDLPGQILFEERTVGGSSFTIQSNSSLLGGMFFPELPVSPATTTACTSSNSVQKNGLYYSKFQQYEHVPTLNYILVGPANKEILRIAPLRDSLIIIKEEGVYRLTGDNAQSFTVTPLDLTVFCKALDSVTVLSNLVFMLSNQGVVAIDDNGAKVISREIEPSLIPLLGYSNLATYTIGCGYESERSFLLSTVTTSSDTSANQIFVYNLFTRAWTRWTFGFNAAIVEPSADKLYFSKTGETYVYRERKDFADTDFADPAYSITITAISGNAVTFSSSSAPQVGWVIALGATEIPIESFITNATTYTATMRDTPPDSWTAGAASLYPNVGMDIEWNAWNGGKPNLMKQVSHAIIMSDNIETNNSATGLVATFRSNFDDDREEIDLESTASLWGSAPWGDFPWGGSGGGYGYMTYVPRNKQYCSLLIPGFKHKIAREHAAIVGVGFVFRFISERVGR